MQELLCGALELLCHLAALLGLINAVDNKPEILLRGVDAICLHYCIGIGERCRLRCRHEQHLIGGKDKVHDVAPKPCACIHKNQIGACGTVGEFLLEQKFLCMIVFKSLFNP